MYDPYKIIEPAQFFFHHDTVDQMDSPLLRPQPNPKIPSLDNSEALNSQMNGHDHQSHACSHDHGDDRETVKRKLRRAIALSLTLMIVEIVGGVLAHSLAIVTDAAHLLSDVSGFAVSLFAVALSQKIPTLDYTYGYHQAEILGALTSVLIVWAMTGVLLFEAINRFISLEPVDGRLMLIMAVIGLVVNFALFGTLHHGHDHGPGHSHSHPHGNSHNHSHNHDHSHGLGHQHSRERNEVHPHRKSRSSTDSGEVTGFPARPTSPLQNAVEAASRGQSNLALDAAVVHIIGDIVQSLGVLLAAILIVWQPFDIGFTEDGLSYWYYADPFCTFLFSILVMATTFRTVSQSVSVLMHRAPEHVDLHDFDAKLREIPGVKCIHDVHVWMVGSRNVIATAHVVVKEVESVGEVLNEAKRIAIEMGIGHSTFQLEVEGLYNHAEETFGALHSRDDQCCSQDESTENSV